jgi:hypothetical protein
MDSLPQAMCAAGASAAALAYLGYLQAGQYDRHLQPTAFRLSAFERWWLALDLAQRTPGNLEYLVTSCESAPATEQVGWVQQMNDTLEQLK